MDGDSPFHAKISRHEIMHCQHPAHSPNTRGYYLHIVASVETECAALPGVWRPSRSKREFVMSLTASRSSFVPLICFLVTGFSTRYLSVRGLNEVDAQAAPVSTGVETTESPPLRLPPSLLSPDGAGRLIGDES